MKSIFGLRFYIGTAGWGWTMYGIGWGNKWFIGFSKNNGDKP